MYSDQKKEREIPRTHECQPKKYKKQKKKAANFQRLDRVWIKNLVNRGSLVLMVVKIYIGKQNKDIIHMYY